MAQNLPRSKQPGESDSLLPVKAVPKAECDLSILGECLLSLQSGLPIACGYLLQNSLQLFSIGVIGRLGSLELSIAASGYMIATSTAWVVAIGGTTALDSLGSAVFTDTAQSRRQIGVIFQQCLISMAALYAPVACLWWNSGPILSWFGQDDDLAYGTQEFLRWLSPFALAYILFESVKKYLQCQHIRLPGTIILFVVSVINVPLSLYIVHRAHYGLIGGVISTGSMYALAAALSLAYNVLIDGHQAWPGWRSNCLSGLAKVFKLVLLGIFNVGAEWWSFEIIAITAGTFGAKVMAAQSIIMTVDGMLALIPFGLGVATTNRVGNLLGNKEIHQAKKAARAASLLAVVIGAVAMAFILLFRAPLSLFFSNDEGVTALAISVFPIAAAFQIFDGLQAINSASLRALGRVDIGAGACIVAYYFLAIPTGFVLAIPLQWGIHGLWLGLAMALAIVGVFDALLVTCISWDRFAKLPTVGQHSNQSSQY